MTLPHTLLLTYQIEYETTDISIESLCTKYDVQTKQLKGYTKWAKRLGEQNIVEPTQADIITSPIGTQLQDLKIPKDTEELLESIEDFKRKAVAHAIKFMKDDAEFAEVKEFKDMVAIVDSIEKSYKDTKDTGPTVNILIQNLTEKFQDDC